jgi:predicted RNase H-like HicB family nuclease
MSAGYFEGVGSLIETFREGDRYGAVLDLLPGVMAYGKTLTEARRKVRALAFAVVADRLKHEEWVPPELNTPFMATRESTSRASHQARVSGAPGGVRRAPRKATSKRLRRDSRGRR